MVIFRSIFQIFLSFNTQLTHLNACNLRDFDSSNRFLPIASQSLCSGVSKMATSGRWQAPAAVLPPEGWQRGRGPEGPEDKGHGHSRARRAREWPKHASPRARRTRGRAKLSARLGACQCYYMFFTTQLKIAKFMGHFQDLNVGQKS